MTPALSINHSPKPLPRNVTGLSAEGIGKSFRQLSSFDKDPSGEIDRKFRAIGEALAAFKEKMSPVSMHFSSAFRSGMIEQVERLLSEESWDETDSPPTDGAFNTFLRFMLVFRPDRRPGIGADGDGSIIAAWTVEQNRLTIECFAKNKINWHVTRLREAGLERAGGESWVGSFRRTLEAFEPNVWFKIAK